MSNGVVPRGYYLAHEAGWLAGVSGDRIGQWARRGYIQSSISHEVPRVYSYQDVAEAMVVHDLLNRGVPLRKIRRAIELLRVKYGDWPLTEAPVVSIQSSAGAALALDSSGGALTDLDRDPNQVVLGLGEVKKIASDLRRGGWAVRSVPDLRHIEVDPDRISGRPAIRGTRVPAELVARLARTQEGRRVARRDYDVSEAQIKDAVRWWEAVESLSMAA